MTKDTKDFIITLFEDYAQSSSGKEEENAATLDKAWHEVESLPITV